MTAMGLSTTPAPPSAAAILKAMGVALVAALVLLITVVLPAEYGIDPLGTGRVLGLTRLAEAAGAPAAGGYVTQDDSLRRDTVSFTLQPKAFVEYKYRLDKTAGMVYAWSATGTVAYDFHTEPEGTVSSASESFEKGEADARRGSYVAPYNGIHGWYWENKTAAPVTITLTSTGFYRAATEFLMDGSKKARDLLPATP